MATITASTNIKNVTYAAGETLTLNNSVNSFVRLTIDAQDAGDVAKLAGTNPGVFNVDSVNAEVYVVNTSTTVPLVVKIDGERSHLISGLTSVFKARGDWISIGTGTGADNQTISVANVGGKLIDWPPFVEVETAAGSGVYVQMFNIGGSYNDGYSGSGLTPTAYPFPQAFANVGKTRDLGHVFEFDEQNSTIKFGSAAVGGWIPPNGANIRIPNIHFTGTLRPNATRNLRNRFTTTGGVIDLQRCSFSNRWGFTGSQFWPYSFLATDVGMVNGNTGINNVNGPVTINGMTCALDLYANNAAGIAFQSNTGPTSISRYCTHARNAGPTFLNAISNLVALGEYRCLVMSRTSAYHYAFYIDTVKPGGPTPVVMGPIYLAGGPMSLRNCELLDANGVYFSDWATGQPNATNSCSLLALFGNNKHCVVRTVRLCNGGVPSNTSLMGAVNTPLFNCALHDVVIDGQNPSTFADWMGGINTVSGQRLWYANMTVNNFKEPIFTGSANATANYPNRASNIECDFGGTLVAMAGMHFEQVSGGAVTIAGAYDVSPVQALRTSGKTVGMVRLYPGARSNTGEVTVNSGTEGTDFYRTGGALYCSATGVQVTLEAARPIRGVSSAGSVVFTGSGASYSSGTTFEFAIRNAGDTTWPAWQTLNAANFNSAFTGLTGYSAAVGFEIRYRVTTTSAVAGRVVSYLELNTLSLDAAFTPSEVGFVQIGYTNPVAGASVAVIDRSGALTVKGYTESASGGLDFEYPYAYDGSQIVFRMVARKAGYAEVISDSTAYLDGASVPVWQTAAWAVTDADVADITPNGVAKTLTVAAAKTCQQLYQKAQWWAHQRTNMIYDTPVTSRDGNNFTLASGWELTGAANLSVGTLVGGSFASITPGTLSAAFNGSTLKLGVAGSYTFTATNGIVTFTPTAPSTYALGGGTFSGTIDLRNTTAHAITVELPSGTSYTTANNTGGAITVTLPVVTANISITGMPTAAAASTRLQIINRAALAASAWAALTEYSGGDIRRRTTGLGSENTAGLYLRCTTAGASGAAEPTWNTSVGGTTADGSAVWTTYAVLFYDADPVTASLADTYIDGEEFLAGETVEIRFAEMDAATSFKTYDTQILAAASGFSVAVNEEADTTYATNALNGSSYESTFSPNFAADYIVLDSNADFSGKAAYAYFCYTLTTGAGMYEFWGGVTALDPGNYRINVGMLNLYFDESAGFVKQTDDVRIFRSDGVRPALDPTTGGNGIEINWRTPVSVVSTGGSALTPTESSYLLALPVAATNASAVRTELATELAEVVLTRKLLRNKRIIDRVTGIETLYDDDGSVLYTRAVKVDEAGTIPYDGTAAPHRVERYA